MRVSLRIIFLFSGTKLSLNYFAFCKIAFCVSLWTIEQNAVLTSSISKHFCGCDINQRDKTILDKTFVNLTSAKTIWDNNNFGEHQ